MRYEGQIYRPFSEANSYLLQCTIGCAHNRCTFCGMYKDRRYQIRSLPDIKADIQMAKDYYSDLEKVFLCDGDALAIETGMLLEILNALYVAFPSLRHVGTYAGPNSILEKDMSALTALRAAGLTKAYLGVESGDERVLADVKKGVTAAEMLRAGQDLVKADINLSSMVLLGIAGRGDASRRHAEATAEITNRMRPRYLAALTYTPVPNTALYHKVEKQEFELPGPLETIEEMKIMIENISIDNLKFIGAHASNYLPVSGDLQKDKDRMLAMVSGVLEKQDMSALRPENFRGL